MGVAKVYSGDFVYLFLWKYNTNKATFLNLVSKHSFNWVQNCLRLLLNTISDFWQGSLPLQHLCAHMHVYDFPCRFSLQHAHALTKVLCIINILYTYISVCIYIYTSKMVCITWRCTVSHSGFVSWVWSFLIYSITEYVDVVY